MELRTDRLTLRSFRPEDITEFAEICADPEVMRYLNRGQTLSYAETEAYIRNYVELEEREGYSRNAVTLTASDRLIGMCGLAKLPDYVDLGYRFARSAWGQGYATEAWSAVVEHGFATLGLPEIVALIDAGNAASVRVVGRLLSESRYEYDLASIDHEGSKHLRFTIRRMTRGN